MGAETKTLPAIALLPPPHAVTPGPTRSGRDASAGAYHDPRRAAWRGGELLQPPGPAGITTGEGAARGWSRPARLFPSVPDRSAEIRLPFPPAAFLAQHIAQEVLSAGLYREAWDVGAVAYARAAAEFASSGPAAEVSLAI